MVFNSSIFQNFHDYPSKYIILNPCQMIILWNYLDHESQFLLILHLHLFIYYFIHLFYLFIFIYFIQDIHVSYFHCNIMS